MAVVRAESLTPAAAVVNKVVGKKRVAAIGLKAVVNPAVARPVGREDKGLQDYLVPVWWSVKNHMTQSNQGEKYGY